MLTANNQLYLQVKDIFTSYLETHKQRKTPERYKILEEIYSYNHHFDAEELYEQLINKKINISRATVYNTLELLLQCELITKHQFGQNHAMYEKCFGSKQHDHLICLDCGQIIEFCEPRLQGIKDTMSQLFDKNIKSHSLNLYGNCTKINCENKLG